MYTIQDAEADIITHARSMRNMVKAMENLRDSTIRALDRINERLEILEQTNNRSRQMRRSRKRKKSRQYKKSKKCKS